MILILFRILAILGKGAFVSLQIILSVNTNVRLVHSDNIYSCYIPDSGCL